MRTAVVASLLLTLILVAAAPASAQPACGQVITQDTTLTADLDCDGDGLVIGAPGITLDLGGHKISANRAVINTGHADVTIRNGSITFDTVGVQLIGARGNTIRDLAIDGLLWGIELRGSDRNRIVANNLLSALIGLDSTSDRNVVRENVTRGHEGVITVSGSYNRLVHNIVWTTVDTAMSVGGHHNEVLNNGLVAARGTLLALRGVEDSVIANNHLVQYEASFGDLAVYVTGSSRNVFRDNEVASAPLGILIESGARNVFRRNLVEGAVDPTFTTGEPDGFGVQAAATGTLLQNNDVHGFADDGIDVEAPSTTIRRNTANQNGDLGIEAVPGVIDGGGNTASGNGNPLQCTNVFCG
jgi:parallel beta-helix repeat protein